MNDKKKKFAIPEAELIDFGNDDIVTVSGVETNNADWTQDPDVETFVEA